MTDDVELERAAEIDELAEAGGESGDALVSGGDAESAGQPLVPHHDDEQHVDLSPPDS
jgi:hypothetical protein